MNQALQISDKNFKGQGFPEAFFGSGNSVNRSTGERGYFLLCRSVISFRIDCRAHALESCWWAVLCDVRGRRDEVAPRQGPERFGEEVMPPSVAYRHRWVPVFRSRAYITPASSPKKTIPPSTRAEDLISASA